MNELLELLGGMSVTVLGGGVVALIIFIFLLKKLMGGKKKKASGGNDYGDSTTASYDTKSPGFIDELNSASVLTQDVQDFAIPNFDRAELEKTTSAKGSYKKKVFNAGLPGMTLGDTRSMVPSMEEDMEGHLDLRSEIKAIPPKTGGFGLKPKVSSSLTDIATISTNGIKVLDDAEQLMRPASPQRMSADNKLDFVEAPMSMKGADLQVAELNLSFEDLAPATKSDDLELSLDFTKDSEEKSEFKMPDFPSFKQNVNETKVELETLDFFASDNSAKKEIDVDVSDIPGLKLEEVNVDVSDIPSLKLEEVNVDVSDIPGLKLEEVDVDVSDIPGLKLEEVDVDVSDIPGLKLEEVNVDPYFTTITTKLDENIYPETVAYHQEINTALFLDEEGMKEQALQTLNNAVELIKNVKVKFYFKLAIQSYSNSTKEKALPEIIKNFYDFEVQKHSK